MTADDSPFQGKARRAGIFVALRFKNEQSSVGATSSEYAAPTGLADFIGSGFYKDAAPTALWWPAFCCRHHFHGQNKKFSTRFGNGRIQRTVGKSGLQSANVDLVAVLIQGFSIEKILSKIK